MFRRDDTAAGRAASRAGVLEAHQRAGRRFRAAEAGSFVREQATGPSWSACTA